MPDDLPSRHVVIPPGAPSAFEDSGCLASDWRAAMRSSGRPERWALDGHERQLTSGGSSALGPHGIALHRIPLGGACQLLMTRTFGCFV